MKKNLLSFEKFTFYGFGIILVFLGIEACGPENPKSDLIQTVSHLKRGAFLFETQQSASEIIAEKNQFLTTSSSRLSLSRPTRPRLAIDLIGIDAFDINIQRPFPPGFHAPVPVLHTYHGVSAEIPFAMKLPDAFRFNIPKRIRDLLSSYEASQIDLFVTIQENPGGTDYCLKPGFWMFPEVRSLNVTGSPPQYNTNVEMMLYDSDFNINHQVVQDRLLPFQVILHDNLISPDTGNVSLPAGENLSFYSLVVFERDHRAALTLHWLFGSMNDYQSILAFLYANIGNNLETILRNIGTVRLDSGALLNTLPLYQKLHSWLTDPPSL